MAYSNFDSHLLIQQLAKEKGISLSLAKMALCHSNNIYDDAVSCVEKWLKVKPTDKSVEDNNSLLNPTINTSSLFKSTSYYNKETQIGVIVQGKLVSKNNSINSNDVEKILDLLAVHLSNADDTSDIEESLEEWKSKNDSDLIINHIIFNKQNNNSLITTYIHDDKTVAMIELTVNEGEKFPLVLEVKRFAFSLAMHIIATKPLAIDPIGINPNLIASFRSSVEEDLMSQGKSIALWATITEGKLNRWYETICLNYQNLLDGTTSIANMLTSLNKKFDCTLSIKRFGTILNGIPSIQNKISK